MILVTGATGQVGGQVVRALAEKGVPFRALVRRPGAVEEVSAAGAPEVAVGDFHDTESMRRALEGVTRMFLISTPAPNQVEVETAAIRAAKEAGVQHLVKLSALGGSPDSSCVFLRWNYQIEQEIGSSGIPYTFLRPNGFLQNFLGSAAQIAQGALYAPAGDAAISYVDTRDIGDVAATVLAQGTHAGEALAITGPKALTHTEIAAAFSDLLGKPVTYYAIDDDAMRGALKGTGMPDFQIEGLVELYRMYRTGAAALVSDIVPAVTGHPARTLQDFLNDHKAAFTGAVE